MGEGLDKEIGFRTQTTATSTAPPSVVYDTIADLKAHLEWSGERADREKFKLLALEGPSGPAMVGTEFTSSGAADNGTFHDRSVVVEATPPRTFVIETHSRLDRTKGETWHVRFTHRYDVVPEGEGSRITYTETVEEANYVPYWLKPVIRRLFAPYVNRDDRRQLQNLARLAAERRIR